MGKNKVDKCEKKSYTNRKHKRRRGMKGRKAMKILLGTLAWFLVFLGIIFVFLAVSEAVVDQTARVLPSYEKEDLTKVLEKEVWTEEDYEFLFKQTGVGRSALDEMKGDNQRILAFQEALFYEGTVKHSMTAFSTPHDYLEDYQAPIVPLQDGDVLVTSTCHTFGWRNGHAALVVDGTFGNTLECYSPGNNSNIGTARWFQSSANFMVLRLKGVDREKRAEIAEEAIFTLKNIPYSLAVGIFFPKDQGTSVKATHCSHLVWQAYQNFGYEIDSDGGPVCTTRDIANSPLFEKVQVFGFDPEQLW